MISNCSAAGADSIATGPAGIVQRKNETTGMVQPATVRPNGAPPESSAGLTAITPAASTAPATMAALLFLQEV